MPFSYPCTPPEPILLVVDRDILVNGRGRRDNVWRGAHVRCVSPGFEDAQPMSSNMCGMGHGGLEGRQSLYSYTNEARVGAHQ